eukprot:2979769-Pleurochrysis_carterae.AAC.1
MSLVHREETSTPSSILGAHSLSNFEADYGVLLLGEEVYDLHKKQEKRENLALQYDDGGDALIEHFTQSKECPINMHTGKRECQKKKQTVVLLPRYE